MATCQNNSWAVILAGGDGTRLTTLTRLISGDARPKQFCPIFGGRTLLGETRARLARLIPPERTLVMLQEAHESFYREELAGTDSRLALAQPANKGTAVAIAYAVLEILGRDENATVAFFPADHYYQDDTPFLSGMRRALHLLAETGDALMLVGAPAVSPEVEYGWIEPAGEGELAPVRRFWEKPSRAHAEELLARGCLWNTFVMLGRARAFLDLIDAVSPRLTRRLRTILRRGGPLRGRARCLFSAMPAVDFSHQILSHSAGRLLVYPLRGARWSDLGKPERVIETMAEAGLRPSWAAAFAGTLTNKAIA